MRITTAGGLVDALLQGQEIRCRFREESDETNLRFLEVQELDVLFRREDGVTANIFYLNKHSLAQAWESYSDFEVELPTDIPFSVLPV